MNTIWAKDKRDRKNINVAFYCFLPPAEKNTTLEIVAANLYRIFINGMLVGYGPARAAHGFTRKDTYMLSENEPLNIVVEVFGSNVNSYYLTDEPPFFGAAVKRDGNIIASTDNSDFRAFLLSDRVIKVQRYSFQRPFAESYNMKKCRTHFYNGDLTMFEELETEAVPSGEILERGVDYPGFDEVEMPQLIEWGTVFKDSTNNKWLDRSLMGINDVLRGYKYEELEDRLSDEAGEFSYKLCDCKPEQGFKSNTYKLYDFGKSYTGFFIVNVSVTEPCELFLLWDELIYEEEKPDQKEKNICFYRNGCCNVIKYNLCAGDYKLLSFEPTTARFVKIISTKGEAKLNKLSIVKYENPDAFNMVFHCEDKKLVGIIEAAQNTFAQNAVDILTDCPSRERAGWLCDSYFSSRAEKLFTGINKVEKNFLQNYSVSPQLSDLPEGMLPMCYPADHYDKIYIPNWAMWFVLELGSYLKRTNDRLLIDKCQNKVYNLINFFKKYINEDGLLENLESWVFVEWSMCNDPEFIKGVNYPSNMLYSRMLSVAGELYGDEALILQSLQMKKKIIEQSFNGEFFEENRIRENGRLISLNHTTETCQYYAFYFGIADKEDFTELYNRMVEFFGPTRDAKNVYPNVHISNAIVGNYLRLEYLIKTGKKELAIQECKSYFSFMAERTGTLWEHSYAYGSLNHGFASVAANYIIECLFGYIDCFDYNKTVYVSEKYADIMSSVKIPISNDYIEIKITEKGREIKIPDGYKVKYIS